MRHLFQEMNAQSSAGLRAGMRRRVKNPASIAKFDPDTVLVGRQPDVCGGCHSLTAPMLHSIHKQFLEGKVQVLLDFRLEPAIPAEAFECMSQTFEFPKISIQNQLGAVQN